jgi:hypothetical protein
MEARVPRVKPPEEPRVSFDLAPGHLRVSAECTLSEFEALADLLAPVVQRLAARHAILRTQVERVDGGSTFVPEEDGYSDGRDGRARTRRLGFT